MGIKRQEFSGRRDSRGRKVMVSGESTAPATESNTSKAYSDLYRDLGRDNEAKPADQLSPGKSSEVEIVSKLVENRKYETSENGRKVVALDIDGVMADFNAAMKPYSTAPEDEEAPEDYNYVRSKWFKDFDEFEKAHLDVMDRAGDIPLNDPTAAKAIETLRDNGFTVIAITARREQWRDETLRFFRNHDIPISSDELHFVHNKDKTGMHFDYLLDDAPKNIVDALSNSRARPVVYSQRYNSHLPGERVKSMMDFANLVCRDRDKPSMG